MIKGKEDEKEEIHPEEVKNIDMNEVSYLQMRDGTIIVICNDDEEYSKDRFEAKEAPISYRKEEFHQNEVIKKTPQKESQISRGRNVIGTPIVQSRGPLPPQVHTHQIPINRNISPNVFPQHPGAPFITPKPAIQGAPFPLKRMRPPFKTDIRPDFRAVSVGRRFPQSQTYQPGVFRARPFPTQFVPGRKFVNSSIGLSPHTLQPRSVSHYNRDIERRTFVHPMQNIQDKMAFIQRPTSISENQLDLHDGFLQERFIKTIDTYNNNNLQKDYCFFAKCLKQFDE